MFKEVTESIGELGRDMVYKALAEFKKLGYRISLDDFGTKYSNMDILSDVEFDVLKLDKSLVDGVGNERNRILVESMIKCFHAIGVDTITEGVETEEQNRILRELGTDKIQGYYYSRPLPEGEFLALVSGQGENRCTG